MTTKDYLGQAYRIDQRINSKLEQVTSLRELATKATSTISDMPHAPSKELHPMENIIVKMVALEDEINSDIDELVDLKHNIFSAIREIVNLEYQTLLELRYLCYKSWEQISVSMDYDIRYLYKLHSKALDECEIILRGQEKTL